MRHDLRLLCALSVAVIGAQAVASAHFKLLEPASWIVENERGEKKGGGTGDSRKRGGFHDGNDLGWTRVVPGPMVLGRALAFVKRIDAGTRVPYR